MNQEKLLTLTINGNSTLTILFEEVTQNETSWKESLIIRNLVPITFALIIVSAVILLYVRPTLCQDKNHQKKFPQE
jgi:hypothetical protein